jgi:hypothetical protein
MRFAAPSAQTRLTHEKSTALSAELRDALDTTAGLSGVLAPPVWLPAGDADERQHTKLWAASQAAEIEPSDVRRTWKRLSTAQRTYLTLLGVSGDLARAVNQPPPQGGEHVRPEQYFGTVTMARGHCVPEIAAHRAAGWYGVIAYLLAADGEKTRLWEALVFGRWDFVPEWCEYKRHWYFRHKKGRRPNACVLHQKAARQARWRASPDRRRQGRESAVARRTQEVRRGSHRRRGPARGHTPPPS